MQKHFFEKSTAIYFAIVNQKKLILISTTLRINIPPPAKKKQQKNKKTTKKVSWKANFLLLSRVLLLAKVTLFLFWLSQLAGRSLSAANSVTLLPCCTEMLWVHLKISGSKKVRIKVSYFMFCILPPEVTENKPINRLSALLAAEGRKLLQRRSYTPNCTKYSKHFLFSWSTGTKCRYLL